MEHNWGSKGGKNKGFSHMLDRMITLIDKTGQITTIVVVNYHLFITSNSFNKFTSLHGEQQAGKESHLGQK